MYLDQKHVGSGSHGRSRHGSNFVANSGAVRRVGSHGQVRQLMNDRDGRDVEGVASISLKCANATLTQNYIVVSAGHDVFGGEQQFFQRRGNATLEQDGLLDFSQLAEQIEILHVARSDLEDVHERQHDGYLRNLHDLADHQQTEAVASFA